MTPDWRSRGIAGIAAGVRERRWSASEIVEEALAAAERLQPKLNAFTLIERDTATERAADLDRRVADGADPGPLAGVPVAVKDLIDHEGRPTTLGTGGEPTVAEQTARVVARLEEAGAVVVGRTGLHELAFGFSSENHWYGPVQNPWDPATSPGGSSGGSAAAVASGIVPMALGTDTGGSIRVPAALCGVVGLKVTHGRIPLTGVFPLAESLDTVGPIAATVGDAALVYRIIAGDDPEDAWSAPVPVTSALEPADLRGVIVGIPRPWVDDGVAEPQLRGLVRIREAFEDSGATVVEVDAPELGPTSQLDASLYGEVASVHRQRFAEHPDTIGPEVASRLARAIDVTLEDYVEARRWRAAMRHAAERRLQQCEFLLTPTVAALRKEIGDDEVEIRGSRRPYRPALARFTAPVNHMGFPALALPVAGVESAPPPSVQLIAGPWREHRLLEAAMRLDTNGFVAHAMPPIHAGD